jgi:hypothetical protein
MSLPGDEVGYTAGMAGPELDFARYVAMRRGHVEQRAREGAVYAYVGAQRLRRTLTSARPVALAIEATNRLWNGAARADLLSRCTRATDETCPAVVAAAQRAGRALGVALPPIYLASAESAERGHTLGTDDEPCIVLNRALIDQMSDRLSELELVALVGHYLGDVQNNHVAYTTALYYLTRSAASFVRWIVRPAVVALQAWSRRAQITCDRAALLCTMDLDATIAAMVKVELGPQVAGDIDIEPYLQELAVAGRGLGKYAELFRSHPLLPKRVNALRLFAESSLYRRRAGQDGGEPTDQIDHEVSRILSVFS